MCREATLGSNRSTAERLARATMCAYVRACVHRHKSYIRGTVAARVSLTFVRRCGWNVRVSPTTGIIPHGAIAGQWALLVCFSRALPVVNVEQDCLVIKSRSGAI